MVLFVFVIMLLNAGTERKSRKSPWAKYGGIPLLVAFLGVVAYLIGNTMPAAEAVRFGDFTNGTALDIGRALFTTYLLPFEVTSVLILIAILGAIVLARKEID